MEKVTGSSPVGSTTVADRFYFARHRCHHIPLCNLMGNRYFSGFFVP